MALSPSESFGLQKSWTRWGLIFGPLLFLVLSSAAQAADQAAAPVEKLIAQLGSQRYAERHKAARALDQLGVAVLPELAKAVKNTDPEIRRQARRLIELITRRDETEKLLAGTQVQLSYRDISVSEIAADLSKKTGFAIAIVADPKSLATRKITLEAGKTPFWKAVDLLCEKAQLVERGQAYATTKVADAFPSASIPSPTSFRLYLVGAKFQALPTSYFLGARVRALPPSVSLADFSRAIDERVIALEISLDPARRLKNIIGLRIDRASDVRGLEVGTHPQLLREKKQTTIDYRRYEIESVPAHVSRLERGMDEGNFRRVLVQVKAGQLLKELNGVLTVEVQKPSGPVFTVDNILKATGKSFSTPDGGTLTISGASINPNGKVEIRVETSFPLGGRFGGIRIANGVIRIRRVPNGEWETVGIKTENLKLLDKEGRTYSMSAFRSNGLRMMAGGLTQTMTLTCTPPRDKAEPARLVYYGEPTTFVDVPFTLKNVPLQ